MAFTTIDNTLLGLSVAGTTFVGIGKSRILNGDMRFDQVNAGASSSISGGSTQFTLDMWASLCSNGSFSIQRLTATPPTGFTHYMRVTTTSATVSPNANDYFVTQYSIEGNNTRDFLFGSANAKVITVSFWVRSSLTGNFGGSLVNGDSDRSYPVSYTISVANTWEYKTITLTGDLSGNWTTDAAKGMKFVFDYGTGTDRQATANVWGGGVQKFTPPSQTRVVSTASATWDVTGMQLELGSAATPFEFRPQQIELAMLQRYFEKTYALETSVATNTSTNADRQVFAATGAAQVQSSLIPFVVPKRVAPTFTFYTTAGTSGQWTFRSTATVDTDRAVSTNNLGTNGTAVLQTVLATELWAQGHWTAAARMA